jgi:phosphoribosyl 1,2-cyclic phosphodiesterase
MCTSAFADRDFIYFLCTFMSLYITSLNSGSNGNCYYIGNEEEAVLVDAGISCRETERRMASRNLSMKKVKAIFISHEHIDHVRGLAGLASKYALPVYVTDNTKAGCYHLNASSAVSFSAYNPVSIGSLTITAFPKFHDAADPHSFIIEGNGVTIGVFTDIGQPCDHLRTHFQKCHAAFLEANYDDAMLEAGRYPLFLKNRIRGGHGHLSNKQALEIFTQNRSTSLSHLLLSHLSKDNNSPELVKKLFQQNAVNTQIIVASRYEATPVYLIKKNAMSIFESAIKPVMQELVQASLF